MSSASTCSDPAVEQDLHFASTAGANQSPALLPTASNNPLPPCQSSRPPPSSYHGRHLSAGRSLHPDAYEAGPTHGDKVGSSAISGTVNCPLLCAAKSRLAGVHCPLSYILRLVPRSRTAKWEAFAPSEALANEEA